MNNFKVLTCVRCGYIWASRAVTNPLRCAKCHAKYWDRAARIKKVIATPVGPVGRPHKYPVHLLNIGQTLTVPHGSEAQNISAKQSVNAYGIRAGRQFTSRTTPAGIVFTRIL